jgi:hypothetical protein
MYAMPRENAAVVQRKPAWPKTMAGCIGETKE